MRIFRTAALTSALAVAALVGAGAPVAGAASPTAHGRPALVVSTVGKHGVHAPRHAHPGLVRVRNDRARSIVIVDPVKSAGVATLVKEVNAANDAGTGPLGVIHDFALVDALLPHDSAYVPLSRGVVYFFDGDANKITAGDVGVTHVAGARRTAVAPKSVKVTVTRAGTLAGVPTKQFARSSAFRVLNKSKRLAEVLMLPVDKTVSATQLKQFLAKPSFEDLFKIGTPSGMKVLGLLSPHRVVIAEPHAKAGRNLLLSLHMTGNKDIPTLRRGQVRLLNLK